MGACGSAEDEPQPPWPMLLLGSTGVGKTTMLRNIQMISKTPFREADLRSNTAITVQQMLGAIIKILEDALEHGGFTAVSVTEQIRKITASSKKIVDTKISQDPATSDNEKENSVTSVLVDSQALFKDIIAIMEEDLVEKAGKRCDQTLSSTQPAYEEHICYFLENDTYKKISEGTFLLDSETMLHFRGQTKGFTKYFFTAHDAGLDELTEYGVENFSICDVAGHLYERTYWTDHYQEAKTLWFIVALDDYHKNLKANKDTELELKNTVGLKTRLDVSLKIFEDVCAVEQLENTDFMLVLNKQDRFKHKMKSKQRKYRLSKYYSDFSGDETKKKNFDLGIEFIFQKFKKIHKNAGRSGKNLSKFVTTATDAKATALIINTMIREAIMNNFRTAQRAMSGK